ncbi:hypothetical protein BJX70DRAFT_133636 [Aspergillus crustosus]
MLYQPWAVNSYLIASTMISIPLHYLPAWPLNAISSSLDSLYIRLCRRSITSVMNH